MLLLVSKSKQEEPWQLITASEKDHEETESLINALLTENKSEEVIYTTHPIEENDFQVLLIMYDFRSDILRTVKDQSFNLMLFASLSILASMLGAFFIAKTITKPVNKLIEQTPKLFLKAIMINQ